MTLGGLHPYLKSKAEAVGLKEWKDGFNTANIPSTLLNNSFHVQVGAISGQPDHQTHSYRAQVAVKFFFKGFRDPQSAIDAALDKGQEFMAAVLKSAANEKNLKNVRSISLQTQPLAETNDNAVILEIALECFLIYSFT